jgi:cobalt-precorrin 5A hydrolase/precorrin-3B C17-methyltransferase
MTGTLYGLGIGPGDAELITVKAARVLASAPVIAYPAPEGGRSLVRQIAAPFVPAGRIEVVIETPMCVERFPAQEVYDRYAAILAAHLAAGRDVALLCEGDPFFYGSFMYLFERLKEAFAVNVVPGVSSLTAASAVAGLPLVQRDEVLTVLPATLPAAELTARLGRGDALAVFKVGRHLEKLRNALARAGRLDGAVYVERATMAEGRTLPLAALEAITAPYFSLVLVPAARRAEGPVEPVPPGVALVALSAAGARLAARITPQLPAARCHGLAGRTEGEAVDATFADATAHLQALFRAGTPIVGICAAGILIRAVAPLLADKRSEPPVVAVSLDGYHVVPLLGGHQGANALARALAKATGGVAAITTGGDSAFGLALDEPPPGWRVANPAAAKAITADLIAGRPVGLVVEAGEATFLTQSGAPFAEDGARSIHVTDRAGTEAADRLVLHPPVLALGVGCERGCPAEELTALVNETIAAAGLAKGAIAVVVSLELKADEPAVHALANALGVPARFFSAERLEAETPRLAHPSDVVFREVGCHGVAEAAALAAAGSEGELIVTKRKSARATCAIARSPRPIDVASVGRPRGQLAIVGIGPGGPAWRTPEVTAALTKASDIVGYQLYLDLIGDLVRDQRLHAPPMTEEVARARLALDLAADGRRVCLVSSGDAGIYGLAALVYEQLERENRAAWNRVAVAVLPGMSALQAAAARAGAPLGHDFCAISLSDLLTPWAEIERRLQAAADGDFVVALYNPVSQRRRSQLLAARDILLTSRPAATPVVLARNLGRDGETVAFTTLADLDPADADMLTLILIGASRTRRVTRGGHNFVYTPRGYATKGQP